MDRGGLAVEVVGLIAGLVLFGAGMALGFVVGISASDPTDEELSAAYSRGCNDCRPKRPPIR